MFVPSEHVFLDGEVEFAAELVERFTAYHRRSYVCKAGVGDVLIGAAALIADYNGVSRASHIRDKLVEMAHLNETMYAAGIAASHEGHRTAAGNWEPDHLLANVCKQNVTRFPYEIARLAQDLAGRGGGDPAVGAGPAPSRGGAAARQVPAGPRRRPTEHRVRALRLIENLTLGRNAVGYLTESLHGAGSPQAQRVVIRRQVDLETRRAMARRLAGIPPRPAWVVLAPGSQPSSRSFSNPRAALPGLVAQGSVEGVGVLPGGPGTQPDRSPPPGGGPSPRRRPSGPAPRPAAGRPAAPPGPRRRPTAGR